MASLRRLNNSPFYIACITLPDGNRTNRSTKSTHRRIAQRIADEWQSAADNAREGKAITNQTRRVLDEIALMTGQPEIPTEATEDFLNRWLAGKTCGGTARRYRSAVNGFIDYLRDKRRMPLGAISYQDVLGFIKGREKAGVAPKTLSIDIRALHVAFNVARKLNLLSSNPVERALALRPIASRSNQRECFKAEQITALLHAARGDWKTAVLLGYYTGARLGDCVSMRWGNVNFALRLIDFVPQKAGKRVVVPIHPNLLSHLQNVVSPDRHEEFLCPSLASKTSGGKNGLSLQFKGLLSLANIDPQLSVGLGVRQFSKLSFHSLRHSFNSDLANTGVDQETRMKLTGHGNVSINNSYTHLDLPKLRDAIEKLPTFRPCVRLTVEPVD